MCRTDINTLIYYIGGTCSKNFSWQRFATKLEHQWLLVQWLHHLGGKTVSGLYKQLHWAYISNQWHVEKRTHRFGPPTASQPWSKREPKHRKAQEARVVGSLRGACSRSLTFLFTQACRRVGPLPAGSRDGRKWNLPTILPIVYIYSCGISRDSLLSYN